MHPAHHAQELAKGLFVTQPVKKGAKITWYHGSLITHEEALQLREANNDSHIVGLCHRLFCVDGIKEPVYGAGGASFANDPRGSFRPNAKLVK